jgi:predicted acetyltransferase
VDIEIRNVEPAEFDEYMQVLEAAFSAALPRAEVERIRKVAEFDRLLVALEGGRMVGGAGSVSFRMTVPGGDAIPVAAVVGVGVLPTHRRRGINTELMRRQLDDVKARGEAVAALYASEANIYGRFGYGIATFEGSIRVEKRDAGLAHDHGLAGSILFYERDEALPVMREIHERAVPGRPGMMSTSLGWFDLRMAEHESETEPAFFAVHSSEDGRPDGYVVYHSKRIVLGSDPLKELNVIELQALNPEAEADLWRFIFGVDLIDVVRADRRPVDESLLRRLAKPRSLRFRLGDGLHVRLVDVEAALRARGYSEPDELVIEVEDRFCPWNEGTYALTTRGEAGYERTSAPPQIRCGAEDLGAVYLGGTGWRDLARAGRATELSSGALERADRMFASYPPPWSSFHF